MPFVRRSSTDIDRAARLADLARSRRRSEAEIEQEAREEGGALTDAELADRAVTEPRPIAAQVRACRR